MTVFLLKYKSRQTQTADDHHHYCHHLLEELLKKTTSFIWEVTDSDEFINQSLIIVLCCIVRIAGSVMRPLGPCVELKRL